MTVLVGLSPGDRPAPAVTLGAALARSGHDRLVVAAVVPEPWPPQPLRLDEEYLDLQAGTAREALDEARRQVGEDLPGAEFLLRRATSVPTGLLDVAVECSADRIVLGSSRGGAADRVSLGGVANRLLHSAGVPIAIPPQGYLPGDADRITRMTVAFGRGDGDSELLAAAAKRAESVAASLRVVCFAIQPTPLMADASVGRGSDIVTRAWVEHLTPLVEASLARTHPHALTTRPDLVVGRGDTWAEALADVPWAPGDILVVGTSSSPVSRFFLGSHAAKIVRNSPVPVLLVPRS